MIPSTCSCCEYKLLFCRLHLIILPCEFSVVLFLLPVVSAGFPLFSMIFLYDILSLTIYWMLYWKTYFQE